MQAAPILLTFSPENVFCAIVYFPLAISLGICHSGYMSKYEIAANIELAGKDNFQGIMAAADQRALFGRAIFGRKVIKIDASNQGIVKGSFSVGFGQDRNTFEMSFEEIATLANNPTQEVRW